MQDTSDPYSLFVYALNSPVSRERYTTRLKWFFSHIGLAEGSIEERCRVFVEKGCKDNAWVLQNVVRFLTLYKDKCNRREVTGATIRNYVKAIKLFCEMNDIMLPWKKLTRGLPKGRRWADDRAPTLEEIRRILDYPDKRIKPIVTTMVSSGIRVGAWDYLKWGHVSPIEREGQLIAARLTVYGGEEEQYPTFISPEAWLALKDWMTLREKAGEIITKDSWLMRNLWDSRVAKGRGLVTMPKRLKASGVKALMESALWTQGIRTKLEQGKHRHPFQADHGFRKFYKSRAEQAMKPINVEILMDHTIGIGDSYYRPRETELLEDYLKAVPLLTISQTEEVRRELIQTELKYQSEVTDVKALVASLQSQVSFLSSSILYAKTQAHQASGQSQGHSDHT